MTGSGCVRLYHESFAYVSVGAKDATHVVVTFAVRLEQVALAQFRSEPTRLDRGEVVGHGQIDIGCLQGVAAYEDTCSARRMRVPDEVLVESLGVHKLRSLRLKCLWNLACERGADVCSPVNISQTCGPMRLCEAPGECFDGLVPRKRLNRFSKATAIVQPIECTNDGKPVEDGRVTIDCVENVAGGQERISRFSDLADSSHIRRSRKGPDTPFRSIHVNVPCKSPPDPVAVDVSRSGVLAMKRFNFRK